MTYLLTFLLFFCLFFLIKKQLKIKSLKRTNLKYELKREQMKNLILKQISEKGIDTDIEVLEFLLNNLTKI
jgi:hypothetical protein